MQCSNLLIIGSSTGGPRILEELFTTLPPLNAAVLIVQHITKGIDESLAASLSKFLSMPIRLAADGDPLQHRVALLAPGGLHLTLANNRTIRLSQGEKVNSVCPSIDVAMNSAQPHTGGKLAGVILTGMGRDGADGIAHIKKVGGITIAQDQSTSVIYGMPKAAAETGCVDFVLTTSQIGRKLSELFA
jgi:two-component system chemotaxis response regulator CheB